jgi:hypothetical protein
MTASSEAAREAALSDAQETAGELNERAAMQALVNSLRGDFAEAGIVPPPRNYAGVELITQLELANGNGSGERIGTLDTLRLLMVKSILSHIAGREDAAPSPDAGETTHLDMAL